MEVFYFLAAFFLVRRLSNSLKTSLILFPKWRKILIAGRWVIVALYIINTVFFEDIVGDLVGSALLFTLIYLANKEPDFTSQRANLYANLPLAAIGIITAITKLVALKFYDKYEEYFVWAIIAAFVWIFGRLATFKKQSEELRINAERRAELELLVQERTTELIKQKEGLLEIVKELKSTQNQLIQSEKMASLGELTAGIAHEIQNPLNFVNNFSEVSMELLDEMAEELEKGDTEEAKAIAEDVKQNLEKIRHHGKRADGIVKGMLQHSRASSGQKELTDLNTLADEYLRLAYHGLRAKDKSFNAELITNFDTTLPKADMVPQDVGRVLLNLFTNAFYAVQQKQKNAGTDFKPTVQVTTSFDKKFITVKVKDNGTGIPEAIKDKIMQPFFTTKPTGEGTGLGLSMSYDIVVKAHNGKIDIATKEGDYTEFTVRIPA